MTEKFPLFIECENEMVSTNIIGDVSITILNDSEKLIKEIKEGNYVILPELIKDLKTNKFKLIGFHITLRKDDEL